MPFRETKAPEPGALLLLKRRGRERHNRTNNTHTRKEAAPIPKHRWGSPVLQLEHAEAHGHARADGDEAGVRADREGEVAHLLNRHFFQ